MNTPRTILAFLAFVISLANLVYADDFDCPGPGHYADESDPTCKHYFLCIKGPKDKYTVARFPCPENAVFSKEDGRCSMTAKCNSNPKPSGDKCTQLGVYEDSADPLCKSYYECNEIGKPAERKQCPGHDKFDPENGICTAFYVCPEQFKCERPGRFPDKTDSSNMCYFLCSRAKNGTMVVTPYTCPTTSLFDEKLEACYIAENPKGQRNPQLPMESWQHLQFECASRGRPGDGNDDKVHYECEPRMMAPCRRTDL